MRLAAAALLLGSALGCATARIEPLDVSDWVEIGTRHFVVAGNVPLEELQSWASELSVFHALIEKVTTANLEKSRVPVRLYLFRESAEAERFIGWAAGAIVQTLPGYFAILGAEGADYLTRGVLFHEYVHYVVRRNRPIAYPRWYDEGLSEFLSTVRFREDAIIVGAAPASRLRALQRVGPMPLEELFDARDLRGREIYSFYASSWALVHYLNQSREGRARLSRFVARLVRGEPWQEAYPASFDRDLAALQADVDAHVERLANGVRFDFDIRADSLQPERKWIESAIAPAEIAYQLGYITRLTLERSSDSEDRANPRALFEQAIELDATHARARAALAWIRAMDGDFDRSEALLARALVEAPGDPVVILEKGRIAAIGASAAAAGGAAGQSAREALELATQLDPSLAEAHAALGQAYAAAGTDERAIASYQRGRELGAWSPEVEVELAEVYLRVGDAERAEALLIPVAADPHGGDAADEARRLLDVARGTKASPAKP